MPPLLPGLMQEAPGVSLQSIAADPFQVRQLLEEERIDVAVSVNKQSRGEIVSEPVMSSVESPPCGRRSRSLPRAAVGERLCRTGNM